MEGILGSEVRSRFCLGPADRRVQTLGLGVQAETWGLPDTGICPPCHAYMQ